MRFLSALVGDARYQIKYGFYFLYAFISAVYAALLLICPVDYRRQAASVVILTDPAMLGAFFIGGIWLMEKGEGLHGCFEITPLRPAEYALSKAVSLALISTVAGLSIALAGLGAGVNYLTLAAGVFFGGMLFTLIGLLLASYARSVNHYMLIATLPLTALLMPPLLAAFGLTIPVLDLTPGMALWRIISFALDTGEGNVLQSFAVLAVWFCAVLVMAVKRLPRAMRG